jgi:flagellar protein FliJ
MPMARRFTLQPLLDRSRTQLSNATSELGQLIAREQEGSRKLELLQGYRAEYAARFRDAVRDGLGVETLRNYGAFMARIDEAIDLQQALLDASQKSTDAGKQAWIRERNRVKAFDTLHERHIEREQHDEQKREQRQSDEHTTNRYARGNGAED